MLAERIMTSHNGGVPFPEKEKDNRQGGSYFSVFCTTIGPNAMDAQVLPLLVIDIIWFKQQFILKR